MKAWQIAVLAGALLIAVTVGSAFLLFGGSGQAAATVNGVSIPEVEVEKQLTLIKQSQGQLFKGPGGKEQEKQFREQVLSFLINAELVKQEAQRLGITVSDKDLDARLKQVRDMFPKKEQFTQALKDQGLDEAQLREKIREQAMADKMMARVMKGTKISEKDKQKYFADNKDQFVLPEQRHWRQIATKTKKDADAILSDLRGGADFAETAKKKSVDERAKAQGGDIGWVGPNDFPPEIGSGLAGLEVNGVSEVIEAGADRFYIFRLEGVREKQPQTYKEVAENIEQKLMQDAQQAKFSELIGRLTKEAKIEKS